MLIEINKQVRDVYVVIYDPKKLVRVLDILNRYGVRVKGVDTSTKSVQGVIVVDSEGHKYLTLSSIDIHGYTINIDEHGLEKGLALTIVFARTSIVKPLSSAVVGIDYGKSIGVAVMINNDIVYTHSYRCKENALKDIKFFIENVNTQSKIIRIGIASALEDTFIDMVINIFRDVARIELVPEHSSSKLRHFIDQQKLKPDEVAAINIALYRSNS